VSGLHINETFALRTFWLAHLGRNATDGGVALDGWQWQSVVHAVARSVGRSLLVQGPGAGRLFGRHGASGMAAEIDTALDDGAERVILVEAKAVADYALSRDAAFVFAGKIRDHERGSLRRRRAPYALLASAGRLDAVFCRWSFYEGIDVLDPDRLPLAILARLPFVFPGLLNDLEAGHLFDWLCEVLAVDDEELRLGPVLLRRPGRRDRLQGTLLEDMNQVQAALSEDVLAALSARSAGHDLRGRVERELAGLGLVLPDRPAAAQ
jgi:hypothetical protein